MWADYPHNSATTLISGVDTTIFNSEGGVGAEGRGGGGETYHRLHTLGLLDDIFCWGEIDCM